MWLAPEASRTLWLQRSHAKLKQIYYWARLNADVTFTVPKCVYLAKKRLVCARTIASWNNFWLFNSWNLYLLTFLLSRCKSRRVFMYFILIVGRFTKLVQVLQSRRVCSVDVAHVFSDTTVTNIDRGKHYSQAKESGSSRNASWLYVCCSRVLLWSPLCTTHKVVCRIVYKSKSWWPCCVALIDPQQYWDAYASLHTFVYNS